MPRRKPARSAMAELDKLTKAHTLICQAQPAISKVISDLYDANLLLGFNPRELYGEPITTHEVERARQTLFKALLQVCDATSSSHGLVEDQEKLTR
jgi:hypothetical protein